MLSSTSNSNDRLPACARWGLSWLLAVALTVLVLSAAEYFLRSKGFVPSMADSIDLWAQQRLRIDRAPTPPIVALGTSRIQMGLDLNVLERRAGTSAVQLAIDGVSFVPVLQQLASDDTFTGTVLVSLTESILEQPGLEDTARRWLAAYAAMAQRIEFNPFPLWEARLSTFVNSRLALRTEGAPPYVILQHALTRSGSYSAYLTLRETRERLGDYTLVPQPGYYAWRVKEHFGENVFTRKVSYEEFVQAYNAAIEQLKPNAVNRFLTILDRIMASVAAIEKRGGRVIFVRFPTDKMVWEIDRRRFPRATFWQRLVDRHPRTIHFKDYPELDSFALPDGSHLDMRDRKTFTAALADIIERRFGWQ
ncbi:MAG: hypothetical protein OET44_10865 [Gammaproteobacteria bacterium]|nr:hypothetical protein [Gammaproteobacteria bacterium]